MNPEAQQHIEKAVSLLGRGENFYRLAADEVVAALALDPTLGYREIGKRFDRSHTWVKNLVAWSTSGTTSPGPYSQTGRPHQDRVATRKVLREAPLEEIEQMLDALPEGRKEIIAAAAGHSYLEARKQAQEQEAEASIRKKAEKKDAKEKTTRKTRQATGAFASLGIIGHIEQATDELRELMADASLTPETAKGIARALETFTNEFAFAKQLLGGGE